jgi:hypothetical protein
MTGDEMTATPPGLREQWHPGDLAWFEYHCWEDAQSGDAELWFRSHQQVTVTGRGDDEDFDAPAAERLAEGVPRCYGIRFPDGHEGTACEDELLTSPGFYGRPDPPSPVKQR